MSQDETITALLTALEGAKEVLKWYAETVADCRKEDMVGDFARQALARDGGGTARLTLAVLTRATQTDAGERDA